MMEREGELVWGTERQEDGLCLLGGGDLGGVSLL